MSFYNATQIRQFDFALLWNVAQEIKAFNPLDPRLFYPLIGNNAGEFDRTRTLLTSEACIELNSKGDGWAPYVKSDVRQRVQLWKAPLIQLIAQMQLPPLGWKSNIFVIVHLIGDPWDTLWSLSHKIFLCHKWADEWSSDEHWKAMGMVVFSYDEWGKGEEAHQTLLQAFRIRARTDAELPLSQEQQENVRNACRDAAQSLSADRSSSFIPVTVAVMIFLGSIGSAFDKNQSGVASINNSVTPHYIAFTALYFGILPAVFLSAIIGVSQDRSSIPHILKQLRKETQDRLVFKPDLDAKTRLVSGGIYSWQPRKWQILISGAGCWRQWLIAILSFASILSGTMVAIYMSYTAPPTGFGCREIASISTFVLWMISAAFDIWVGPSDGLVFTKDLVFTLGILVYNIYSHLGLFNRCSCWTKFHRGPLSFALETKVAAELHEKIGHEWAGAIILLVTCQLVVVVVVCALCHKGVNMLLSSVRNEAPNADQKEETGWQYIFSHIRRAWQRWRMRRVKGRIKLRSRDSGEVPLVSRSASSFADAT